MISVLLFNHSKVSVTLLQLQCCDRCHRPTPACQLMAEQQPARLSLSQRNAVIVHRLQLSETAVLAVGIAR